MSFADDIIEGKQPSIPAYLQSGTSIDDLDEYGFTPLIEAVIAKNLPFAEQLIKSGAQVDKADVTGRTALHWSVDNGDTDMSALLLKNNANPNSYNRGGQSPLVYPLLRQQWELKNCLYQYGADLNFAQDFINAKLIGHRFELKGDVDIVTSDGSFIELDYEGFFLEFTLAIIQDSLSRFRNNYAARELRRYFDGIESVIDAFSTAQELLKFQRVPAVEMVRQDSKVHSLLSRALVILPVAYRGHAITFVKCGRLWAKCDRGENSLREGTVNIYYINDLQACNLNFLKNILYKKQTRRYLHERLNEEIGLQLIVTLPISQQISGNCSWANVEATVPAAFLLYLLQRNMEIGADVLKRELHDVMLFYKEWDEWDKDRALYDGLQSFYQTNNLPRKASKASQLAAILFQACHYGVPREMSRAERILPVLMMPEYHYILRSYLDTYATRLLTVKGNNLIQIMDDCGFNPEVEANPVPIKKNPESG